MVVRGLVLLRDTMLRRGMLLYRDLLLRPTLVLGEAVPGEKVCILFR